MQEYTNKSLDLILQEIIANCDVLHEDIKYEVISENKVPGFKKITIKAYTYKDVLKSIEDYLTNVFEAMNLTFQVEAIYEQHRYRVNIKVDDGSLVIGSHGSNIQALETLLAKMLSNHYHDNFKLYLDVNKYRFNREKNLTHLAKSLAKEVVATKMDVKLDPMNSYERRLIHKLLDGFEHVETKSYDDHKQRYIIIHYKK